MNFAEGTIETLQPISIVAYATGSPSVRKQTLEIKGRFGSHAQASGLRTGTLGGTITYRVGHFTPTLAAAVQRTATFTDDEVDRHSIKTAHLPLRGLIGKEGAIGVFHGSVGSDVHIIGGFEVSPRAALPDTITASFARWARGATECGTINRAITTINLPNECALGAHTPILFVHPNDLFASDDNFNNKAPIRKGFVLGDADGIDFSNALSPMSGDVITLTLGGDNFADPAVFVAGDTFFSTTGERFTLSGDGIGTADDGIAFIADIGNGTTFYAGLLSGTDLGAPLGATLDGEVTVSWPGRFAFEYATALYHTNDFVLDINLAAKTISTAGVNARRVNNRGSYNGDFTWILQGRYDDSGIITGIIKDSAVNVRRSGTLTGLIGVEGAVGAFFIDETNSGGTHLNSFVGGFVAAPVEPIKATGYTHFKEYHEALTGERRLYPDAQVSQDSLALVAAFVPGTTDGLSVDTFGLTFREPMGEFVDAYKLGGDTNSPDGFVLANGALASGFAKRVRAGILSGTSLGPLVSADVNGLWTGTANVAYTHSVTGANTLRSFALNLEVDFAAGTIRTVTKALSGSDGLLISGVFGDNEGIDLPPGILGGEVTYQFQANGNDPENANLPLIGLIGGDGAIGVFTKTSGAYSYAGGFTAQPFALTDVGKATLPTAVTIIQLPADHLAKGKTTSGGFVRLGQTLDTTNVSTLLPTNFTLTADSIVTLTSPIDFTGGVGYFIASDGSSSYHYAGILANTNLLTPLSISDAPKVATWTGRFSEYTIASETDKDKFVKFHIDYEAGTLQFSNAGATAGGGTLTFENGNSYTLHGEFGHGIIDANKNIITVGQLGGQVKRTGDSKTAVLSGLIGADGAVGAFVDTAEGSDFAGGFWAVPELRVEGDGDTGVVNFSDWSRQFNRNTPLTATIKSGNNGQFLPGLETETEDGKIFLNEPALTSIATVHHEARLLKSTRIRFALTFDADGATHAGYPLGGNARGGVAGFWSGSRYAGILSSTDLGAPITEDGHVGLWRGQFVAYRRTSTIGLFATRTDFILNVGYGTGGNTLTMNQSCTVGGGKSCIHDNQAAGGTATHKNVNYYEMVGGEYDPASGVISGTINFYYRTSSTNSYVPGVLTGLIGRDGAVGTFIGGTGDINLIGLNTRPLTPGSGAPRDSGTGALFFGGFVATSHTIRGTPAVTTMANHANFDYYYKNYGGGDRRLFATFAASGADVRTAFLEGSTTGFAATTGLIINPANPPTIVKLGDDTSSDNGFVLGRGHVDTALPVNERFRAGLLPDTDLGASFVSTPSAVLSWTGSIRMLSAGGITRTTDSAFTLNFTDGTITTSDLAIGTDMIRIAGKFRYGSTINTRLDAGILGGSAFFTRSGDTTEMPLIGLIGANGAIGVFHAAAFGCWRV